MQSEPARGAPISHTCERSPDANGSHGATLATSTRSRPRGRKVCRAGTFFFLYFPSDSGGLAIDLRRHRRRSQCLSLPQASPSGSAIAQRCAVPVYSAPRHVTRSNRFDGRQATQTISMWRTSIIGIGAVPREARRAGLASFVVTSAKSIRIPIVIPGAASRFSARTCRILQAETARPTVFREPVNACPDSVTAPPPCIGLAEPMRSVRHRLLARAGPAA